MGGCGHLHRLNQFEFTRYNKNKDKLRKNDEFTQVYKWLISPMKNALLDSTEDYLMKEKSVNNKETFIQRRSKLFKDEICGLLALQLKNVFLKDQLREIFFSNMYKYKGFLDLLKLVQEQISPLIPGELEKQSLNKTKISKVCNDAKYVGVKNKTAAMLLSYMYLFIDDKNADVGAGDLAVGPFEI